MMSQNMTQLVIQRKIDDEDIMASNRAYGDVFLHGPFFLFIHL